jgi:hypothetical protein
LKLQYGESPSKFAFNFNLRRYIEDGMAFALDHADAARDVVEILAEALTLAETPVPMKVWNDGYYSPRHRTSFKQETRVQNACADEASDTCQILDEGGAAVSGVRYPAQLRRANQKRGGVPR